MSLQVADVRKRAPPAAQSPRRARTHRASGGSHCACRSSIGQAHALKVLTLLAPCAGRASWLPMGWRARCVFRRDAHTLLKPSRGCAGRSWHYQSASGCATTDWTRLNWLASVPGRRRLCSKRECSPRDEFLCLWLSRALAPGANAPKAGTDGQLAMLRATRACVRALSVAALRLARA